MSERADDARAAGEQAPAWHAALAELERALDEARRAVESLRRSLVSEASGEPVGVAVQEPAPAEPEAEPVALPPHPNLRTVAAHDEEEAPSGASVLSPANDSARLSAFERVWERIERERIETDSAQAEPPGEKRRGLDLLPQQYLMTVEDRENQVDLVSVHRALLTLADQEDVALVSFANGTPVVSLRTEGELDLGRLGEAIAAGTNRACEVIPQGGGKVFLRLSTPKDEEGDEG